jgi:hypothetical protein
LQGPTVHPAHLADALGHLGPAFHVNEQAPHLLRGRVDSGRYTMLHDR